MSGRDVLPIVVIGGLLALIPFGVASNTLLNFLVFTLIIAIAAQGWNVLGGYGGQISFGHSAFFGTGAYATAILQVHAGVNAWLAFGLGILAGALVGLAIGALSFRAGLRGSYFALITLAFAEVFRIVANTIPLTGAATGILIKLDARPVNFQFHSRAAFFWIGLVIMLVALIATRALERSRFGAFLVALRENEDAAKALGVDTLRVKLGAITLSAAITGAAGCLYAQYFLYLDPTIAYGVWISVEALLAPIVGGLGTAFGPLIGALTLHGLGNLTSLLVGRVPGIDLVVYGILLVLVIAFAPTGLVGLAHRVRDRMRQRTALSAGAA